MRALAILSLFLLLASDAASALAPRAPESEPDWDWPPHPDETAHLIFNTVNSLLQAWPNAIYRHGHTIVPATIPAGTVLYHGRSIASAPTEPDWLAFDAEHAYLFANSKDGHVFTLAARRALRLVYFDGSSAAKLWDGSMDTQDLLIYGRVRPEEAWSEWERIRRLCAWGAPLGIDGFVRMEFHFEVMYCDFSNDGLMLLSSLNLLPKDFGPRFDGSAWHDLFADYPPPPPGHPALISSNHPPFDPSASGPPPGPPPDGPGRRRPPMGEPVDPPAGWTGTLPEAVLMQARIAGKWHDRAPGETRVRLDPAGLVSFYDPALRSLVAARRGQPRAEHRLLNVSRADAAAKVRELEDVLRRGAPARDASGVDWASVTQIVVERYGARLELLAHTLASPQYANITAKAAAARAQVLTMLVPYITTADAAPSADDPAAAWLAPIAQRCATTQLRAIPWHRLTPQERLVHAAVEGTLREICRRLARMWRAAFDVEGAAPARAAEVVAQLAEETGALMEWLDWAVWIKCRPACADDELCIVPTWPFRGNEDPNDMTPRCVRYPSV